jgi:hypothetical protein
MPVHDWAKVPAGTFHHFHTLWLTEISNALNAGINEYDGIKELYAETCDYVHFSGTHLHSAIDGTSSDGKTVDFKISPTDCALPVSVYLDAIHAFRNVTRILIRYVEGWTFTKNNPENND